MAESQAIPSARTRKRGAERRAIPRFMVVLLPITLWSGTERLLLTSTITRMGYGIIPHQLGPVAPMADLTAEVATHKGCSLGDGVGHHRTVMFVGLLQGTVGGPLVRTPFHAGGS